MTALWMTQIMTIVQDRKSESDIRHDQGGHGPVVLLAYKERNPAVRRLWDVMYDVARDERRARVRRKASWRGRALSRDYKDADTRTHEMRMP
jgi:hypothetical protein